jgi:hypothetical protein
MGVRFSENRLAGFHLWSQRQHAHKESASNRTDKLPFCDRILPTLSCAIISIWI